MQYFCSKEDPKPEITDFDGTDLISLIKDNFAKMWTKDPYFMSAASSNALNARIKRYAGHLRSFKG